MKDKNIIVTTKTVRYERSSDRFRAKLQYTTTKGVNKSSSLLFTEKEQADNHLNFRVNGLKNSGVPVLLQKRNGELKQL